MILIFALGCSSSPPESDEIVPLDHVPANIMEVARKQLPGYTFDTAYKMKIDGKDAYEVRGKDKRGKVREVEVSADGEVLLPSNRQAQPCPELSAYNGQISDLPFRLLYSLPIVALRI